MKRAAVSELSATSRGRSKSPKLSAARMPVQCTGLPTASCSSQTRTSCPARAIRSAAYSPAGPPPTMRTSQRGCGMCDVIISASLWLDLRPARFPRAPARDPERERDQLQVEVEARAFHVEAIEAELARARDVA